jgi:hypothetical protein
MPTHRDVTVADHQSIDLAAVTANAIVLVVVLAFGIKLIPAITAVLLQLVPPLLVLWLIVVILRGMVSVLLP